MLNCFVSHRNEIRERRTNVQNKLATEFDDCVLGEGEPHLPRVSGKNNTEADKLASETDQHPRAKKDCKETTEGKVAKSISLLKFMYVPEICLDC